VRDPEGQFNHIVMTLQRSAGTTRTNEVMVSNTRNKETSYYKVGDDFDGGKLVYVHRTGALVSTMNQYHVYPLGLGYNDRMEHAAAIEYPELKAAAERAIARETARVQAQPKASPIEGAGSARPEPTQPTLDSKDPGAVAPAAVNPTASNMATEGPVEPSNNPESEQAVGPPGPPEQVRSVQPSENRTARPNPRPGTPNNPQQPPQGGNPRPRSKKKGRL